MQKKRLKEWHIEFEAENFGFTNHKGDSLGVGDIILDQTGILWVNTFINHYPNKTSRFWGLYYFDLNQLKGKSITQYKDIQFQKFNFGMEKIQLISLILILKTGLLVKDHTLSKVTPTGFIYLPIPT